VSTKQRWWTPNTSQVSGPSTRLRALFWVKDELPPMVQSVGVTTAEFARDNREMLRKLVRARRKGVDFV
jgi:NitT/TauT family transport system substrate-binding protein